MPETLALPGLGGASGLQMATPYHMAVRAGHSFPQIAAQICMKIQCMRKLGVCAEGVQSSQPVADHGEMPQTPLTWQHLWMARSSLAPARAAIGAEL